MPVDGVCRCHLPLARPKDRPSWLPSRDPEPPPSVRCVAFHGQDPLVLRMERVQVDGRTAWHTVGAAASHREITPPERWGPELALCWRRQEHPVVDVT
jgi:hypothetical protein